MSVSFKVFLDQRRLIEKTKKFPLKLRVTYRRVSKEFETIYELSAEDFDKLKASRISPHLVKIKADIETIESDTKAAINRINPFSFWFFTRDYVIGNPLFKSKKYKAPDQIQEMPSDFDFSEYYTKFPILKEQIGEPGIIRNVFISYIKQLLMEKRIGTAKKYRDNYISLKKFGGENICFQDITVSWLRRYESFWLDQNRSKTTVGMALRSLRCIFNQADHEGIINKQHCYPFGRRKYIIPTGKKVKKALTLDEIAAIYYDVPSCPEEEYAKSLWFFCYFGNGINPKDLAHLKFENIEGDYFNFYRAKTELTSRNDPKLITVFINDEMRTIMDKYGNKDKALTNYIFNVMKPGLTPLEEYEAIPRLTKFINDWMKKIGVRLGLRMKITTVVTRHSFSTVMKRSGVSTEFIQEALGHANIRTTENYLDSFDNEMKKEYAKNLMEFKKIAV